MPHMRFNSQSVFTHFFRPEFLRLRKRQKCEPLSADAFTVSPQRAVSCVVCGYPSLPLLQLRQRTVSWIPLVVCSFFVPALDALSRACRLSSSCLLSCFADVQGWGRADAVQHNAACVEATDALLWETIPQFAAGLSWLFHSSF